MDMQNTKEDNLLINFNNNKEISFYLFNDNNIEEINNIKNCDCAPSIEDINNIHNENEFNLIKSNSNNKSNQLNTNIKEENLYEKIIKYASIASSSIGGSIAAGSASLTASGFTSSGIAGGSLAAILQSSHGAVQAGSLFATLQSLGATGTIVAAGISGSVFLGLGIAGIIGYNQIKSRRNNSSYKESSSNENSSNQVIDKEKKDKEY